MNNTPTRITGKEPDKAIKLKELILNQKIISELLVLMRLGYQLMLSVRYLLAPGELEGGERRRATDPIWSIQVYYITRSVVSANQPVLYYLQDGPRRGFVREELQVVPHEY